MTLDDRFKKVLAEYGIHPVNSNIYQTAFTHRSFLNESRETTESNERMEFLGDSVLSFIVSTYLFETRQHDNEGDLTNLRAYMVKTDSLAKAAQKLHLGDFLRLSKGEEVSGGRENLQILANTFEATLGAIYLDLGIEAATKFINETLLPLFQKAVEKGPPRDPKSQLQELAQSKFKISPKYRIINTEGPDHAKMFTVGVFVKDAPLGQGTGPNKQQAEEEAAKEALKKIIG